MEKKLCPHCGKELQEGADFCLHCMEPLGEKRRIIKEPRKRSGVSLIALIAAAAVLIAAVALFVIFNPFRSGSSNREGTVSEEDGTSESAASKESETVPPVEPGTDTSKQTDKDAPMETGTETQNEIKAEPPKETKQDTQKEAGTVVPRVTQTEHVHTDACYVWVVDTPYRAAVYKEVKVVDTPYRAAEYGEIPVEYTDYHYSVYRYPGDYEMLYFSSRAEFDKWFEESGAVEDYNEYAGSLYIDGSRVFYTMKKYDPYTAVRYEYGLISPEQPEVSHVERQLVTPEQQETGHFEPICGYE